VSPARPSRPLVRLAVAGAAVLALTAGVGCSSDEDITRADFRTKLLDRTDDAITEDQATCITDAVYDAFGQDDVNTIVWAATEDEMSEDMQAKLKAINEQCKDPKPG
jgi:hypothetical protein